MNNSVGSKKMENGIVVFLMEKEENKYESFNYSEMIDMKINALDLLERPKSNKVDAAGHKLIVKNNPIRNGRSRISFSSFLLRAGKAVRPLGYLYFKTCTLTKGSGLADGDAGYGQNFP